MLFRSKGNDGWDGAGRACAIDYGLHDELMAQVQPIEHAQRQHGGAGDFGVICAVKKAHSEVMSDE